MTNRDSWCTPKWLADALGRFDVDPCSNERSHIQASHTLGGENPPWGDGLSAAISSNFSYFVNPPYSRGQVARWVDHYIYGDFTFLLRWDPSTAWFRRVSEASACVWFARQRINFEPPPGVTGGSNPYPHALFMRNWPGEARFVALSNLGQFWERSRFFSGTNYQVAGGRP